MEQTTCRNQFIKYTSLNVLGMLGLSCYILADTFFVSKGLGANGLAALNLAIPIYSFIHGSGLMIGMGGATKYAICQSRNSKETANHAFTNAAFLVLIFAAIFFFLGLWGSEHLAHLLGADATVFQMAKTYLRVILLFAPMFLLNNLLLCFVRNDGAPQLSMAAMFGGSLSNVLLDYIFIFPCQMGIFGAAFATGLAPVISIIILSPFFWRKKNRFHICRCKFSGKLSRNIFSAGLPSLITEVSSGIVIIVFNLIILRLQGNIGVAAYGIIANLFLVILSLYTGIAQGIQPLISSNYGAGVQRNVRTVLRYALLTEAIISLALYAIVFLGASQIAAIFNSEHNALLQNIAELGLKIYFTGCLFAGFNIILSVYFTSTEYARPAHIISLLRGFLLIIPLAILLSFSNGLNGVWCAFPLTELFVSGLALLLFLRHKKKMAAWETIS